MAKIKFGMMMTDASGKLGGHVFAKNRGGSYVRTKGIPTNPQTTFQSAVRAYFASISSAWSGLTAIQRATWNASVQAYARTDVFGDLRNPSGKALFQRLNQNLLNAGLSIIESCPQPLPVPSPELDNIVASEADQGIDVTYNADLTGYRVLIFATPVLSQGTSFIKNDLRLLTGTAGNDGITLDIGLLWGARFGSFVQGDNIHVGIIVVNANGQASPMSVLKVTVNA